MNGSVSKSRREQLLRTGFHTASTVDAGCLLITRHFILRHTEKGGRSLCHRHIQAVKPESHHGTTGNDLLRLCFQSACCLQKFPVTGSRADGKVSGILYRISRHRNDPMHQRSSLNSRPVKRNHRITVIDHAADISRKHGRIQFSSRHRIDQHTLCSLRIFGFQRNHLNVRLILCRLFQILNGIFFIILYRDHALCMGKNTEQYFHSSYQELRIFNHSPIVRSQIGLTFCTVGNDVVDLLRFLRRKLHMSWKACTSHSHNTGFFYDLQDFFRSHLIQRLSFRPDYFFVFSIIFNHNTVCHISGNRQTFFNPFYSSGYRCMDRCRHKTTGFCDLLSSQHMFSLFYHGDCRCADMLRQRIHQLSFWKDAADGFVF